MIKTIVKTLLITIALVYAVPLAYLVILWLMRG